MFKILTQREAGELINQGTLIIADVRDHESFEEGHIEGAIHLSMAALQDFCAAADKNQSVLVYCYHGISSQAVAQHLIDQGFTAVYSLSGGYEAWKEHHSTSDGN